MGRRIAPMVLLGALAAVAGCSGGTANITNTIKGTTFQIHTVYGFIVSEAEEDVNQVPTEVPNMPAPLVIVGSGATFNPTQDLEFVPVDTFLQVELDNDNNGSFFIDFADSSTLTVGTDFDLTADGGVEEDAGFGETILIPNEEFSFDFGATPLQDTSTTPLPTVVGSNRTATFTFTQLGSKVGDTFAGTLVITVTTGMGDPPNAATGVITAKISGQLVNQELGSCNTERLPAFEDGEGFFDILGCGLPSAGGTTP